MAKSLYRRGYSRDDILDLFCFIDWMMQLPVELEERLWTEIQQHEQEKQMPYVTSVERIGIRKGLQQGIQQGIQQGLATERQLLLRMVRRRFDAEVSEQSKTLLEVKIRSQTREPRNVKPMTDLHPSQRYSAKNDPVVTAFTQRVRSRLGLKVRDLRLFGSRARGDAHRYSDYDMLVVVDHSTPAIRSEILEIEVGLLDEYDVLVTSVVRSENEWQISQGYPLARNITREGILL